MGGGGGGLSCRRGGVGVVVGDEEVLRCRRSNNCHNIVEDAREHHLEFSLGYSFQYPNYKRDTRGTRWFRESIIQGSTFDRDRIAQVMMVGLDKLPARMRLMLKP